MKKVDKNFLAIKAVHAHLDDDSDGIIEIEESVEVSGWVFLSSLIYTDSYLTTLYVPTT